MLIGPLIRRSLLPTPLVSGLQVEVHLVVFHKLDAIGWGVAAVWFFRVWPALWQRWSRLLCVAGIALLFECVVYAARADFGQHWFARILFPTFQPLGCALLLPIATQWSGWQSTSLAQMTSALARWSYSLYLVNFNVCLIVINNLMPRLGKSSLAIWVGIIVFAITSVTLAAIIYHWFEAPFLRLRSRLKSRQLIKNESESRSRLTPTQTVEQPVL